MFNMSVPYLQPYRRQPFDIQTHSSSVPADLLDQWLGILSLPTVNKL
jgi:hypothetical protein